MQRRPIARPSRLLQQIDLGKIRRASLNNSIGTSTDVKCSARAVPGGQADATEIQGRRSADAWERLIACACDVIRRQRLPTGDERQFRRPMRCQDDRSTHAASATPANRAGSSGQHDGNS